METGKGGLNSRNFLCSRYGNFLGRVIVEEMLDSALMQPMPPATDGEAWQRQARQREADAELIYDHL